jgi:hypothetical protein
LDQALATLSPENDFIRGVFRGAGLDGITSLGGHDPASQIESLTNVPERGPEDPGGIVDSLQEGFGEFLPLILGSGGAGIAATGGGLTSALGTPIGGVESIAAAGISGAPGFFLAENIATGIAADAALGHSIGEGIVYSAVGTGVFGAMGKALKAGAGLPKFALEQASEAQKNFALRKLAQEGIDPRLTDLTNEITQSGRVIDEITDGALGFEQQLDDAIWITGNKTGGLEHLLDKQKQFGEDVLKQGNLSEILATRTDGATFSKTTATGGVDEMRWLMESLEDAGVTLRDYDILDRVSPTVSLAERIAVLNGNVDVFVEASKRMGIPQKELDKVMEFLLKNPGDEANRMFISLTEQAQTGMLQGRLDVVNPNFNGVDTLAKEFFELPVEARADITKVMKAMGLDKADRSLAKNMLDFDKRLQAFYNEFGGEGKVDPFRRIAVGGGALPESITSKPTLPDIPVDPADVLRGVVRTSPTRLAAQRARSGPLSADTRLRQPRAKGETGLQGANPEPAARVLANGIPLPTNPADAALVRETLFDIANLYIKSKPELAVHAMHALKNFDAVQKEFVAGIEEMGTELGKLPGVLGDFARTRFSLQGENVGTRLLLSNALNMRSSHWPELAGRTSREIFGDAKVTKAVMLEGPGLNSFVQAHKLSPEKARRSFRAILRHEFGHEVEKALKNSGLQGTVDAINEVARLQPYRNDDFSFREMTGLKMGENGRNGWVPAHGNPISESVAELISNLMTKEGRKHIHPDAREVLELVGLRISEPYAPNRPAFQRGPQRADNLNNLTGEPFAGAPEVAPSPANIFEAVKNAFPGKGPSAKTAGNAAVGPTQLVRQQDQVLNNAVAALSRVGRVNLGPEKQIGLFTGLADEGLHIIKPQKEVQEQLAKVIKSLGSEALQTFNESLITLPRSAQGKFVKRLLTDGAKVNNAGILDYTRAIREWRASAMLFGPSTWGANIVSTLLNTSIRPATALVAGGIDFARSSLLGTERTRFATDALADIAGIVQGARDAIHFIKSDVQRLRGNQPVPGSAMQELFETGSILRTGGFRESVFQGSDSAFLLSKGSKTRGLSAPVGGGIQVPFQILRISDNALFNMNFTGEMYRQAANQARRSGKPFDLKEIARIVEGKAQESAALRKRAADFAEAEMEKNFNEGFRRTDGSLPVPLKALQDDMIQKALLDTVPEDIANAKQIAEKTIFVARETGQLDKVLTKLDEFDNTVGGAISIALPFRRTPMNIIREGIRTSPLGFLAANETIGQLVGTAPRTAEELVDAYAQATVGTALYAGLTALAYYGVLEGNPEHFEQNRALRTTMLADGRLPETVFVNIGQGKKLSIPLSRMQPIGGLILGALRASETVKDEGLKTLRPDILFGTQVDFIKSLGFQDQVEGTADFMEAIVSDDPRLNFAERFGGSFVPAFIRQGRQAAGIDQGRSAKATEANALTRFAQGFQSGIFNSGLPKLGLFGEPIKRTPVLGAAGVATIGKDPVVTALIDSGSFHQAPDVFPELRESDAQQKHSFVRGKGQLQKQFVKRAIESIPNWNELPVERRKRIIDSAFTRASSVANKRGKNALRAGVTITPQVIISGKVGL